MAMFIFVQEFQKVQMLLLQYKQIKNKFLNVIIIHIPVEGSAIVQDFPDLPQIELPSLTPLEYLAESFLLHLLRVPDSVHHGGRQFLREIGIASIKYPLSDPEMTSVYVTHNKN